VPDDFEVSPDWWFFGLRQSSGALETSGAEMVFFIANMVTVAGLGPKNSCPNL
jgi:hypothetical protein